MAEQIDLPTGEAKPADEAKAGAAAAASAAPSAAPSEGTETKDQAKPDGEGTAAKAADAASAAETKPDGEAKTAVPETYSITLPEGSSVDEAFLKERSAEYKKLGLSDDQAKAEWARDTQVADRQWKAQVEKYEAESNKWIETLKNDKDVGGDRLPANAEAVTRLVDKYFDPELKQYLDATKMGNRPDVFKSLLRIARDMKIMDDQAVKAPPQITPQKKSPEALLFPTHFKESKDEHVN